MLTLCLLLLVVPPDLLAFDWTSKTSFPNGVVIPSCSGQDVTLGWSYHAEGGEQLTNVEWHFTPQGGADQVMATEVMGNFFAAPSTTLHVEYLPNAGIRLHNVNTNDSGTYAVHANINLHGSVVVEEQTATLLVSDDPLTTDGQFHLQMMADAVYDNATKDFHIVLSCGDLKPEWGNRVKVLWRTPDNHTLPSTSYDNGRFFLEVPNPVSGGEYTCFLDNSSPGSLCVSDESPLRGGSTFNVDGVNVQFSLMSARLKQQQENQARLEALLQAQVSQNGDLETRLTLLQSTEEALVRENAHLQQLVDAAGAKTSALETKLQNVMSRVFFHATPTENKIVQQSGWAGALGLFTDVFFDNVTANVGDGYDVTSGFFRAPVSGLYLFLLTVDLAEGGDEDEHVGLAIHVEGQGQTEAWAGVGASGASQMLVHLEAGKGVWVAAPSARELLALGRNNVGQLAAGSASSFAGILIRKDAS